MVFFFSIMSGERFPSQDIQCNTTSSQAFFLQQTLLHLRVRKSNRSTKGEVGENLMILMRRRLLLILISKTFFPFSRDFFYTTKDTEKKGGKRTSTNVLMFCRHNLLLYRLRRTQS